MTSGSVAFRPLTSHFKVGQNLAREGAPLKPRDSRRIGLQLDDGSIRLHLLHALFDFVIHVDEWWRMAN
jgi:hypothetical protein